MIPFSALVEEPTFYMASKIITDHHVRLEHVPVGPEGLDVRFVVILVRVIVMMVTP
jgi:DNA-binding transcriptional MocR family regulator